MQAPLNEPSSAAAELGSRAEYDSAIELWLDPPMSPYPACTALAEHIGVVLAIDTSAVHVFHVSERVAVTANVPGSQASGASSLVALLSWLGSPAQALARWDAHEAIALRVHTGASRYDRNVVLASNYQSVPAIGGIVDFGFASQEDFLGRFWNSAAGAAEVAQDVAGFVSRADRLFLTPPVVYTRE